MSEIRITAQPRDPHGTTTAALRRAGIVPAVYYSRKGESRCLQFEARALSSLLQKEIGVLNVDVNGETLQCIIREVQRHPVRRNIVHVDLMGIVSGQKITAHVPIHPVGTARGIKEGGTLELTIRDIEVQCEPQYLPTHLDVDVSHLGLNEAVRIGDLKLEHVTVLGDPHTIAIHVIPPRTAAAETTIPTGEVAEPEVIREKKTDDKEK